MPSGKKQKKDMGSPSKKKEEEDEEENEAMMTKAMTEQPLQVFLDDV